MLFKKNCAYMYFKNFSTAIVKIEQELCIKFSRLLKIITYPTN